MICELCGKNTLEGFRVRVEGVIVSSCPECSKHGKVVSTVDKPERKADKRPSEVVESFEVEVGVAEDYAKIVRKAREKRGWTQEELGAGVNEPHSTIARIEHGRLEPSIDMAKKLERKLGVKLLVDAGVDDAGPIKQAGEVRDLTLGDMIVVRRRDR
jgi:putative transcription factor